MVHKNFKQWSSKLLIAGVLLAALCGCNNQAKQQEIEKQRQEDSIRIAENVKKELAEKEAPEREAEKELIKREAAERKWMEEKTFTTSNGGPYRVDGTAELFYSNGVTEGSLDKKYNKPYHYSGRGTEDAFKSQWASAFGIPNNDKAKEVYNHSLQKYKEGYDDGYNF